MGSRTMTSKQVPADAVIRQRTRDNIDTTKNNEES